MHEREFRAFVEIAETGRMDAAARKLGYSQPAITYQVKRLEESLGFKLFTRHPSGARLTANGRMVLPSVRAVLLLIDSIRDMHALPSGESPDQEIPPAKPLPVVGRYSA